MKWIGQHIFDLKSKFRNDVDITGDVTITGTLDVSGISTSATHFVLGDDDKIKLGTGDDGEIYVNGDDLYIKNVTSDKDIIFSINDGGTPAEIMRIDGSASNVGIGTASPTTALHVYGTTGIVSESPSNANVTIRRNDNTNYGALLKYHTGNSEKWVAGLSDAGDFTDSTGVEYFIGTAKTAPKFLINSSGNVGIGTSSPASLLDVAGTITGTTLYGNHADGNGSSLKLGRADNSNYWYVNHAGNDFRLYNAAASGSNILLGVDASGNEEANSVGIGTASPASKLHVAGTVQVGVDDTGHDVIFYGATSGRSMLWDESYDGLILSDNTKLQLGSSTGYGDLQLLHDGTNSYMKNHFGDLYFNQYADDKSIIFQNDDGAGGLEVYFRLEGASGGGQPFTVFPDASVLSFGTGHDLRIEHTGSHSVIDNYVGDVIFTNNTDDGDIIFKSDDGSEGTTPYLRLDGGISSIMAYKDILMANDGNDGKIKFGASQDLQIYHDGSNSYIDQTGTGNLYIRNTQEDGLIYMQSNYNGSVSSFFYLHGAYSSSNPYTIFPNNSIAAFGNSADLQIYHDGTNNQILADNGHLTIEVGEDDHSMYLKCDNGSGGTTAYLTLDGSAGTVNLFSTLTVGTGSATMSGILDVTNTSSSYATGTSNSGVVDGDTGAIRTEGGISIAKKGFFGGQLWAKGMTTTTPGLEIRPGTTGNSGYLPAMIYRNNDNGSANYLLINGTTTAFAAYDGAESGGVTQDLSKMVRIKTADSSELEVHVGDSGSTSAALTVKGFNVGLCTSWILNNSVSGVVVSGSDKIYTITHGMGSSRNYGVQVIRNAANSGNGETVYTDVTRTDTTIVVTFTLAPTAGDYTALVTKFPE